MENWLAYNILMLSPAGEHKLIKTCIPKHSGVVTFVIEPGSKCSTRCDKADNI